MQQWLSKQNSKVQTEKWGSLSGG